VHRTICKAFDSQGLCWQVSFGVTFALAMLNFILIMRSWHRTWEHENNVKFLCIGAVLLYNWMKLRKK